MPKIKVGDSTLTIEEIEEKANELYWDLSGDNDLAAELANRVQDMEIVESEEYSKKIARALREVYAINTREFLLRRSSGGIAKARLEGLVEEATQETKDALVNNLQNTATVLTEKEPEEKPEEEEKPKAPSPGGIPGLQMSKKDQLLNSLRR